MRFFIITVFLLPFLAGCSSLSEFPTQNVTMRTPGTQGAKCAIENVSMRYVIYTDETIKVIKTPHDLMVTCVSSEGVERSAKIPREVDVLAFRNMTRDLVSRFSNGGSEKIYRYPKELVVSFLDGKQAISTGDDASSQALAQGQRGQAEQDETRVKMMSPEIKIADVPASPLTLNGVIVDVKEPVVVKNTLNLANMYNPMSSYIVKDK